MFPNISDIYGALPYIGAIWTLAPVFVCLVALAVDYGVINALMDLEEAINPPKKRRVKYISFRVNDTVIIPLFLAVCAWIMHRNPNPQGFYTEQWWHVMVLTLSFALSVGLEVLAVKTGVFTWRQEASFSKAWHTFIFVPMGYWMVTGLVAGWANIWSSGDPISLLFVFLQILWVFVLFYEQGWLRSQGRKTPINAHAERIGLTFRWLDDEETKLPDDSSGATLLDKGAA